MLSNLTSLLAAAEPLGEIDAWAVVLGIGIVFCGLVVIILVCYLMGILAQEKPVADTTVAQPEEPVEQKVLIEAEPEVVVALSAVIAEDMGVDATDFRIISIEKI
ncbi:MAG: OadG family protein [Clostridia bacterium]|nr:OadG family protein [Clostridia bacterium]